jgi:hypothetical protein
METVKVTAKVTVTATATAKAKAKAKAKAWMRETVTGEGWATGSPRDPAGTWAYL